jgi:hypothetical protein
VLVTSYFLFFYPLSDFFLFLLHLKCHIFWCILGPGDGTQFSSNLWTYGGSNQPVVDLSTGLYGPIVVVDPSFIVTDMQKEKAKPCDIDDEFFLYFSQVSESKSL